MDKFGLEAARGPKPWEGLHRIISNRRSLLDCVQVEVTTRCPGRCSYCPHTRLAERWRSMDMTPLTFGRLWPLLRCSGRAHLQGWGEPLLHADFFDMVALARKAGCAVSTTTSGQCMSAALAEQLVESGLDVVAFSLAGTDEESNAQRCGVKYECVSAAIVQLQAMRRACRRSRLRIHIAYLMLASAVEAVRALPVLMQRWGVDAAVVSTLDFMPVEELAGEAFAPHEDEKLAHAGQILRETEAQARRMGLGFHWTLPRTAAAGAGCRENAARSLFVAVDGSLAPCVYTRLPLFGPDTLRRSFGNVNLEDPLAIWESSPFRRFRAGLASGEPDERCRTCIKRLEC